MNSVSVCDGACVKAGGTFAKTERMIMLLGLLLASSCATAVAAATPRECKARSDAPARPASPPRVHSRTTRARQVEPLSACFLTLPH